MNEIIHANTTTDTQISQEVKDQHPCPYGGCPTSRQSSAAGLSIRCPGRSSSLGSCGIDCKVSGQLWSVFPLPHSTVMFWLLRHHFHSLKSFQHMQVPFKKRLKRSYHQTDFPWGSWSPPPTFSSSEQRHFTSFWWGTPSFYKDVMTSPRVASRLRKDGGVTTPRSAPRPNVHTVGSALPEEVSVGFGEWVRSDSRTACGWVPRVSEGRLRSGGEDAVKGEEVGWGGKFPSPSSVRGIWVVRELMTPRSSGSSVQKPDVFLGLVWSADGGRNRKEVTLDSLPGISLTLHSKLGRRRWGLACSDFIGKYL